MSHKPDHPVIRHRIENVEARSQAAHGDNAWAQAARAAYTPGERPAMTGKTGNDKSSFESRSDQPISRDRPLQGLKDPRIEKVPGYDVGRDGRPLQDRAPGEATKLEIRIGHKPGDPPPNYVVDANGKIRELRSPHKRLGPEDHSIVIELEQSGSPTSKQIAATRELVREVEKPHPNLNRSPDIPRSVRESLDTPANIPQLPAAPPEQRGGGVGNPGGATDWGDSGGTRGGNGGARGGEYYGDSNAQDSSSPPFDWSKLPKGGLDLNNPVDRVAKLISSNEGKPTSINWNDNGAGVSVGMFQANQKVGELPMLFEAMASTPEGYAELVRIFGAELASKIKANPNIVRSLDFQKGNQLGNQLEELVQNPLFQQLQLDILRQKVEHASKVAEKYGIASTAGVAIVADMINQFGQAGASKYLAAANGVTGEEAKARAIVNAVVAGSKYGARYQRDLNKLASNGLSFDTTFAA